MAKCSKAARLAYNDKLISAIQRRPIIWDSGRKDYKDSRLKALAWAEAAAEVGCDPEGSNVQARWKSLRDTFTRKHRAWKDGAPSGSGADAVKPVRWPYFHLLMFQKDQVDIGDTCSNSQAQSDETAFSGSQSQLGGTAETVLNSMYSDTEDTLLEATQTSPKSFVVLGTTSPQPSTSNGCSQAPATPRRTTKRKRTDEKSKLDENIERIDKMITDDRDQASLYGQIVAHKLRECPKQQKQEMEMELLQFIAKYTFHDME